LQEFLDGIYSGYTMFLLKLVQAFEAEKLDYAIVGGYAVALHGAIRGTVDVDLVIKLVEKDFCKTEVVMKKMGLEARLPVEAKQVFQFRKEYIKNRNLIAWSFYDPRSPMNCVDIILTHDRSKIQIAKISFHGLILKIASVKDLIQMKKKAGRDQDKADIGALERLYPL
jgi:hypothetical protein